MSTRTLSRSRHTRTTATEVTTDLIYLRISLSRDLDQVATDRQLFEINERREEEAQRTGVLLPAVVYRDENISASLRKPRKGFNALVADLTARRPGTARVWTYEPSRLTRHPMELEELIEVLERAQATVMTVNAGVYDLSTPEGRMGARVSGAVARQEVERKGMRQSSKHYEMARRGIMHSGPRPYGFDRNPAKRSDTDGLPTWVVVEEEAAIIRDAVHRVLHGDNLSAIARDLRNHEDPTYRVTNGYGGAPGVPWTPRLVRQKVLSPHVAGLRVYEGEEYPCDESTGWVPLVDRDEWRQLRALLLDPARVTRAPARPFLLHGLVRTPEGYTMRGVYRGGRCYSSTHREHGASPAGEGVAAREDDLDAIVLRAVFDLTDKHAVGVPSSDFKRRAQLTQRREQLEADLAEALELRRTGVIKTARAYADYVGVVSEELDEVTAQLHEVAPVTAGVAAVLSTPGQLRKVWDKLSDPTRREVLTMLIDRVVVARATTRGKAARLRNHPKRVTIKWREEV